MPSQWQREISRGGSIYAMAMGNTASQGLGFLSFFVFGKSLLDIDQADWARWANQFPPLGIWNWGQE